jgi:hypothetical protein
MVRIDYPPDLFGSLAMLTLNSSIVDGLMGRAAHSLILDVQTQGEGFAVVVRSNDKARIGSTTDVATCPLLWNDESGAARPFIVGTTPDQTEAQTVAAELLGFYGKAQKDDAFSVRFGRLSEASRAALTILLPIFGGETRARNGWKVGSLADAQAAARAADTKAQTEGLARLKSITDPAAKLAAALASVDALGFPESVAEAMRDGIRKAHALKAA